MKLYGHFNLWNQNLWPKIVCPKGWFSQIGSHMALISTDEVCIWLYDNLQYSVTENFITRIPQYILIFTCGNLSQITIENETVFAVSGEGLYPYSCWCMYTWCITCKYADHDYDDYYYLTILLEYINTQSWLDLC